MNRLAVWIFAAFSMTIAACEDVIDVNLNDADPKLVIAGELLYPQKAQVSISRTVAMTSETPFNPVNGAVVTVRTDEGQRFTLRETEPGRYEVDLRGRLRNTGGNPAGQTFYLDVQVDGETFTASSTLPELVPIDSIGTIERNFFGETYKYAGVTYQDPPGVRNYYRFLRQVNGGAFEHVYVTNDKFNDGKYVTEDLAGQERDELLAGDSVVVQLQCIDRPTFDFWNAVQAMNPGNAAPANPPSAFGEQALGYFSAYVMTQRSTIIQ